MPTADSYARIRNTKGPVASTPSVRNVNSPSAVAPRKVNSPVAAAPAPYSGGTVSPYSYSSLGATSYGGDSYSGGAPAGPPPAPSEEDYLSGDAGYQAQLAALMKALELYTADDTAERTRYETDYGEGLKNLGWTRDNPATADANEAAWNWEDQNTASGRAYQGQLNDYASRGMLQSSGYGRANNDLQRSFNDQLGSVNRARTDFLSQRDRDLAAYKNENTGTSQQARAEALARRAAQYAL